MHVSCLPLLIYVFDDPAEPRDLSLFKSNEFGQTGEFKIGKNIVSGQSEHALYVCYFPEP